MYDHRLDSNLNFLKRNRSLSFITNMTAIYLEKCENSIFKKPPSLTLLKLQIVQDSWFPHIDARLFEYLKTK